MALGLGVALANAAAPTAAADTTGGHQSSAGSTPSKGPTSKTRTAQSKSMGATKRATAKVQATSVVRSATTARPGTGTLRPRPAPLTGNSESPANWLLAAGARRELGDHPLEELGRRIGLAVNTVLAPANTLVRNLIGIADPLEPGQCKDGVCIPTSDFSLPFVRTEVTILNLTGGPITLTSLDTKQPLTYGPQEGFVLDNARLVQVGFYQGTSEWDKDWTYEGTMVWSNGSTTVSVDAEAGGASASVSNSDLQTLIFDTPEPINGISEIPARQTVVVLPKAGAQITIDPTDAVGQAVVAMALCKVAGSCGQEVVDEQVLLSAPQLVGNTLFNDGSVDSTNRYKVTHEVTKTSGVEENLKVVAGSSLNFSLGPLTFQSEIGALVQQKYGHSWSDGVTTESQVDLNVPPGSYGQIYVQYPEYHDFVNMTLTESGVTITIPNVEYVSLAPSGSLDPDGTPSQSPTPPTTGRSEPARTRIPTPIRFRLLPTAVQSMRRRCPTSRRPRRHRPPPGRLWSRSSTTSSAVRRGRCAPCPPSCSPAGQSPRRRSGSSTSRRTRRRSAASPENTKRMTPRRRALSCNPFRKSTSRWTTASGMTKRPT
ncbi:hypothetical protein ACQ86B_00200 [Mycolicibacterium aichiense]|uniref:hypothetical protein n=1 Tax=Mycolicibacterium aichiense TaxID=1799 RepID=UPI003D66D8FC